MMYRDGFYRHRIMAVVTIIMIVAVVLVGRPPQTQGAQFVLASWDYPDDYGQGIDNIEIWQYLSGSWEKHPMTTFGYGPNGNDTFEIEAGGALLFEIDCWLNGTLTGVSSLAEGKGYLRHSVLVTSPHNSSVFSKQNFTYMTGSDSLAPMYFYKYNVTLSFSPVNGVIYTAAVDYEIFSAAGNSTDTATGGSFSGTGEINSWISTQSKDATDWYGDVSCTLTLDFMITSDTFKFDYHIYAYREGVISGGATLEVYNFDSTSWVQIDTLTDSPTWYNGTLSNSDYMDTTNNVVMLRLDSDGLYYPRWDYADITIYCGDWSLVNSLSLFFPVGWDPAAQFGYDMFFIVLGLIMIPLSTLYLVRGGRKEMSTDKLFIVLILFFMGIGLVIGGIMP